ncbi:Bifunctional transcriptional activator/DNA repair enzyme Ada [Meyerozyma sp. JA9]|nr:Bifunctional transcriptional activator/DNA repair enzyme Ada [Meyerozyma sp. JA9]
MGYETFDQKLQAILNRDPGAEGHFLYLVTTTKICCRPTCYSRFPMLKNVQFCNSLKEAIEQGYRPCKRCKPEQVSGWNKTRENVAKGCLLIGRAARAGKKPDFDAIAQQSGASKWHFCRSFKNYTGKTPRKYYLECLQGNDPLERKTLPLIRTKRYLQRMRKNRGKGSGEDHTGEHTAVNSSPEEIGILTPEDILNFDFEDIQSFWQQDWLGNGDSSNFLDTDTLSYKPILPIDPALERLLEEQLMPGAA